MVHIPDLPILFFILRKGIALLGGSLAVSLAVASWTRALNQFSCAFL
jgi:hypothetical protein